MAERKDRRGSGEPENHNPHFDKVAKALLDFSRKTGRSLQAEVLTDTFSLIGHEPVTVTLNTAFVDEAGRPIFTIIDTYTSGLHSHQVAMRAEWKDDEPTTQVDQARVGEGRKFFRMNDLALIAQKMIEKRLEPPVIVFPQRGSGRPN